MSSDVSGGCCQLVGFYYRTELLGIDRSLSVRFWLQGETTPEIVVWDPATNYLMRPKARVYPAGLQEYDWPSEVLTRLGVKPGALFVRVRDRRGVYVPAQLAATSSPAKPGRYVFAFRFKVPIEGRCTVERSELGKRVAVRQFDCSERFGGMFTTEWDGTGDDGKVAPAGEYFLHLTGTILAEEVSKLNLSIVFRHRSNHD